MMARILLSNDDGIEAPGLLALAEVLDGLGELCIVAPDRDRSGCGHGITVREDLQVRRLTLAGRWTAYAVSGTPADCVKLGVLKLCGGPPDLVVSGINAGSNLGIDVFYSGTVAAAFEGVLLGIPALAISCVTDKAAPNFESAKRVAPVLARWLLERRSAEPMLLNVNVPEQVQLPEGALRWTRLGLNRRYRDDYTPGQWDGGAPHDDAAQRDGMHRFRLVGDADEGDQEDPTTDVGAVHRGYVSVTPIRLDLTDYVAMEALGARPGRPFFTVSEEPPTRAAGDRPPWVRDGRSAS